MQSPKSTLYFLSILIFILGATSPINAQNLIPNPSFEETNPIKKIPHAMRNFGIMKDWKTLTNTPDAHHPAADQVKYTHNAPNFLKRFGPQEPRTGEGKVGTVDVGEVGFGNGGKPVGN